MKVSLFSVVDHYEDGTRDKRRLYAEVIDQAVLADRLGFDTVWVAEHHFIDYGVVPNPAVLLANLAARTSKVKLGPAVSILPFRDPRQVAEDYAMLDLLSDGRAVLGVGSGYVAPEYAGFSLDFADKHVRFAESLSAIRGLLAGQRVTQDGKYYKLNDVALNVPVAKTPLPISVATGRKESVHAIGLQGESLMFMTYTMCNRIDEVGAVVDDFRKGRVEGGHASRTGTVATGLHTHVGPSDEAARATAQPAFDRYCSTRVKARKRGYDEAVGEGTVLFGSPARVADQIVALHRMGIDEVLTLHNFGLIDAGAAQASMTRLMTEVMPLVRERLRASVAA